MIGHQWWWEFRYPQYNVVTANELYLPIGRTVNFTLQVDGRDPLVLGAGAVGQARRDAVMAHAVTNHTNYLWYTPDSTRRAACNGACVEYCGTSHANMRFKAFTVTPGGLRELGAASAEPAVGHAPARRRRDSGATPRTAAAGARRPPPPATTAPAAARHRRCVQAGFIAFPRDQIPADAVPQTPYPAGLTFDDNLLAKGDAANGAKLVTAPAGASAATRSAAIR